MTEMQPGRELDKLVAGAMGQTDFIHPSFEWAEETLEDGDGWGDFVCPRCGASKGDTGPCVKHYSTSWEDAGQAWEWLEENHPWGLDAELLLSRWGQAMAPAVRVARTHLEDGAIVENGKYFLCREQIVAIPGDTYPHAIALAVIEATKERTSK